MPKKRLDVALVAFFLVVVLYNLDNIKLYHNSGQASFFLEDSFLILIF